MLMFRDQGIGSTQFLLLGATLQKKKKGKGKEKKEKALLPSNT